MKEKIFVVILALICTVVFGLALRGNLGNPTSTELNSEVWKDEGPLELSPERGRYALTYSLLEDKSFYFSLPIARFITPDLGYKDGHYVSLFAPGLSFVLMPGYVIGKMFGAAQLGSYAMISLLAIANGLLIYFIARKLGAHPIPAALGALAFLFGTPAFAYGVSLYQHHLSTFLILASLTTLLTTQSLWATSLIWFFFALSVPVDYPNLILMAPIAIFALGRIIQVIGSSNGLSVRFHAAGVITFITMLAPLIFFMWFSSMSYSNPFQLSGTVQTVKEIDTLGNPTNSSLEAQSPTEPTPPVVKEKSAVRFFKTRNMLNGLYVLFFSSDRGIMYYAPIVLVSLFGAIYLYKRNRAILVLISTVVGITIVFYSLWGDPWGGWAFGSRYLIPAYALLGILVALAIESLGNRLIFVILIFCFLFYSTGINTLGALTSNRNPPQVEVLAMEALSGHEEKYTFARNLDYLYSGKSKSFFYNHFVSKYMTSYDYYLIMVAILMGLYGGMFGYWLFINRRAHG